MLPAAAARRWPRHPYLLVKVVVESNQVEIALEALLDPLESVFFGAAPLEASAGGVRASTEQEPEPLLPEPRTQGRRAPRAGTEEQRASWPKAF